MARRSLVSVTELSTSSCMASSASTAEACSDDAGVGLRDVPPGDDDAPCCGREAEGAEPDAGEES
eukprot:7016016-Prymnesium_polylepis.1